LWKKYVFSSIETHKTTRHKMAYVFTLASVTTALWPPIWGERYDFDGAGKSSGCNVICGSK
jgi:hypothetical protein